MLDSSITFSEFSVFVWKRTLFHLVEKKMILRRTHKYKDFFDLLDNESPNRFRTMSPLFIHIIKFYVPKFMYVVYYCKISYYPGYIPSPGYSNIMK